MRAWSPDAERIMKERFGKDTVIALATADEGVPYVRNVNAYYEEGAFYVVTYGLSDKMQQIGRNPSVAVAGGLVYRPGKGCEPGQLGKSGKPPDRPNAESRLFPMDRQQAYGLQRSQHGYSPHCADGGAPALPRRQI